MDAARQDLFFLYASMLTPVWLRALGAQIGRDAEISTAVTIPKLLQVREESFLADDTMVAGYELGGGWMLIDQSRIGRRAFLGNSGITLPGRKLAKNSLVAVLFFDSEENQVRIELAGFATGATAPGRHRGIG